MLDNICSLPLTSNLFAQAIHPTEPLFSVGLSGGQVETFRLPLPGPGHDDLVRPSNGSSSASAVDDESGPQNRSQGRRLSENGFDTVDSVWRTRRHKGSCRTLAYSVDGATLYSGGTDGLVKAAAAETGQVTAKVALGPGETSGTSAAFAVDLPSVLCTLSPQSLLLGTDAGALHVYDLRGDASSPSSRPSQSLRPHVTADDPSVSEAITSLTPLPPSSTSTSGTSRMWVSTSGSTLAAVDLRKGVVTVSEDQGDMLLSSACLSPTALASSNHLDQVIVGGMSGAVRIWNRPFFRECRSKYTIKDKNGEAGEDQEVEQLALVPEGSLSQQGIPRVDVVAAGMSDGRISFLKIDHSQARPIGEVYHEFGSVDGITALGFDVAGRMISGGAQIIKIWHDKPDDAGDGNDRDELDAEGGAEESAQDDEAADSDSDSDAQERPQKPRKRRKKNRAKEKHGNYGVMAFQGME